MNCQVRTAEIDHDHAQQQSAWRFLYSRSAKRAEVMNTADDIIRGKPTSIKRHGLPYTYDGCNSVLDDLINHTLFANVIQCACENRKLIDSGEALTLVDLTNRVAQRAVAIAMFGEGAADDLGFAK